MWEGWERRGVNQFRMVHLLASRWRQIVVMPSSGLTTSGNSASTIQRSLSPKECM